MGQYRISRNCEASVIQYLQEELASAWSNVSLEKGFSRVYGIELPSVCIRIRDTDYAKAELGGNSLTRESELLIDIFGTSSGFSLDLKDFIIGKLKVGCIYYKYTIVNGAIQTKTANGRIRFLDLSDSPINFDTDKSDLDVHDRFRWLITCRISLGKIE